MSALTQIHEWPVGQVSAAIVLPDRSIVSEGPSGQVFELASLTKPLVAVACLIAVEDGSIGLDGPCGPPGSTFRHVLAHASGLDADTNSVLAEPGTRRIYSNSGFEQLRHSLEEATGIALDTYVSEAVLEPLGMTATTLAGHAHTGATGTVDDLARFASQLMDSAPTLLAPSTAAELTAVAFPGLDGVLPGFGTQRPNDWGLGVEIRGDKHPHWTPAHASPTTFGHFGRSGSLFWVDPTVPAALVVLCDRPFDSWAPPRWSDLGAAVLEMAGR